MKLQRMKDPSLMVDRRAHAKFVYDFQMAHKENRYRVAVKKMETLKSTVAEQLQARRHTNFQHTLDKIEEVL